MTGCIDQIEVVCLPVFGFVLQRCCLRFDGNAAFFFNVHGVEHLRLHFAFLQTTATLNQSIRKRRFTMIDVRNDGEISDVIHQGPATSV